MTDESTLQVRPKDGDSSLSLSKVRSSLIARGRRDAEEIAQQFSPKPTDPPFPPEDYAEAGRLWRMANDVGSASAVREVGTIFYIGQGAPQDYNEAVDRFRKGIPSEFGGEELFLGYCYFYGRGVPKDYTEAAHWWCQAIESDGEGSDGEAQYMLGCLYRDGLGTSQDFTEALNWIGDAAREGQVNAQYAFGSMLANGQGTTQDYVGAYMWKSLAAANARRGDDQGRFSKGRDALAQRMTPQQLEEARRLAKVFRPMEYSGCRPDTSIAQEAFGFVRSAPEEAES